ncbi:MAG: hypothetical protein LC772_00035 [Chloroflexi bacterium]|nr:hypothetical protein [Chloroflexota bacterium]
MKANSVVFAIACALLSLISGSREAWAIHSADVSGPAAGGLEIGTGSYSGSQGLPTSSGTHFVLAGDVEVGFHSRFFGPLYTAVELDSVSANEPSRVIDFQGFQNRQTTTTAITTLGLMQALAVSKRFALSVEGGGSVYVINQQDDFTANPDSNNPPDSSVISTHDSWGGFVGGRATLHLGMVDLTGLIRDHLHSSQVVQAGIGLAGPIPHHPHFGWEVDYQYFGSSSSHANVFLLGGRITL